MKWMSETRPCLGRELSWTHDLVDGRLERYLSTRASILHLPKENVTLILEISFLNGILSWLQDHYHDYFWCALGVCIGNNRHFDHVSSLVQDCSNSIAIALELRQSCTKPSMWYIIHHWHFWVVILIVPHNSSLPISTAYWTFPRYSQE